MKQRKWKHGFRIAALLLTLLVFSGCSNSTVSNNTQAGESTVPSQINRETSAASPALQEESEVRDGTHEDTLATPSDFPASYDYGSGLAADWGDALYRRLPEPEQPDVPSAATHAADTYRLYSQNLLSFQNI